MLDPQRIVTHGIYASIIAHRPQGTKLYRRGKNKTHVPL